MKKLLVLSMMAFLVLGTSVAFGGGEAAWCEFWPGEEVEGYVAPLFYRYAPTDGSNFDFCGNPSVTLTTYAFVHGWSKIMVEHSEFLWEIFKYPADSDGVLRAVLTRLGVSSNSGGTLTFDFDQELTLNDSLWSQAPNNPDPNKDQITVSYALYQMEEVANQGWTRVNGDVGKAVDNGLFNINIDPCSYLWELEQAITIDPKQAKGAYEGDLTISFMVTCYEAQKFDPFRPLSWDDTVDPTPSGGWDLVTL